jgi:flagellar hook-length control protein FliK
MIVIDAPQISSSSVQEVDPGSSVATPGTAQADFAALLFLMLGTPQATNNPVAAGSGETIEEPSSTSSSPTADQEAKLATGDFSAGQGSETTEAGQRVQFEASFPALQTVTKAVGDAAASASSVSGNTVEPEVSGLQLNGGLPVSDPATLTHEPGDSSLATSDEKPPAATKLASGDEKTAAQTAANEISDTGPGLSVPSPDTAGENLSSAKQFEANAGTLRTLDRNAAPALPERLNGEVQNPEGTAADVGAQAVAGPQVVSQKASDGGPGTSDRVTIHRHSDHVPNQFGRVVADQDSPRADDNMPGSYLGEKSQPEKAPGTEANEGDSGFVLGRTETDSVADTSPQGSTRPSDVPISTFTAARELSSDRHTVSAREWRPVIGHVANEIAGHLRINQHEAIIQLDPPDLGKIKIDLHVQGDKLQAHIIAEGHESHALIENHLHELRQALQAQSLDVVDVRVSQGGLGGGGDPTAGFRQQSNGGQETSWSSANSAAAAGERGDSRTQNGTQAASGRVSVWA